MSENKAYVITPEFRLSFPSIFEKASFDGKEKGYEITMLFPKKEADLSEIKALAEQAAQDCWGEKVPTLRPYFKDGDKTDFEGNHGMWVIKATSHYRPKAYDISGRELEKDDGELYPGCWAKAKLVPHTFGKGSKGFTACAPGIGFYVVGIRKARDDEKFGGDSCTPDEFGPIDAESDEIPF